MLPPPAHVGAPLWPWFAGGAVLLLALAALLLRRNGTAVDDAAEEAHEPPPPPSAARLTLALRPTRAGVNLLTATVEAEVVVTNIGGAPAVEIHATVALLDAGAGAEAALDLFAARSVTRTSIPPFTLEPGAERRFRAVATLPLDAIDPLEVAGRPMFVPLVAVSAQWPDEGADRRVTGGFAVGVERVDSAKLAPLWLDSAPRNYDSVAARPHGAVRETRGASYFARSPG